MTDGLSSSAARRLLAAAAPLLEGEETLAGLVEFERYELGGELGRGGMGIVFAAWDRDLGRHVALKVLSRTAELSEAARTRFVREAKAAARLVHPNIATVYDAGPEVIVMQLVDGVGLAEAARGDPRTAASLVRDAALAIHYAHGEGVVHRDLKPQNLMVEPGERPHVYVMDFGLAKELEVESTLSVSGTIVGTPAFMAPEQAAGRSAEVGPRTDVHGLGATLWAVLVGRPPFEGGDLYELLRRVVEVEPEPLVRALPGTSRDLSVIVAKCLRKDPLRRYPTALALAGDLDRWLRGEPVQARPPSLVYRLQRFVSRRQGAFVAGAAAAVLAFLIALPFLVNARAERRAAEQGLEIANRTLTLSDAIVEAMRDARAARTAGVGHDRGHFPILQEAIEECRAFLARHDVGQVWFFLGSLLREQGRYELAVAAFDEAEARDAEVPNLHRERGLALAALYRSSVLASEPDGGGELETWRRRGAEDLAAALARAPDRMTPQRLLVEGQLAWLSGDHELAIARHREVVERDATQRESHLSLARLYLLVDRVELAMRHSVRAGDLLRGYGPAYAATGIVPDASGQPLIPEQELLSIEGLEELLVDFNILLSLRPGDASLFGLRGQAHLRTGVRARTDGEPVVALEELGLALDAWDTSLRLDPDQPSALVNRGVVRVQLAELAAERGDAAASAAHLEEALADYDAAVAGDRGLAVAYYDRALLHERRALAARLALRREEFESSRARSAKDALAAVSAVEALEAGHPLLERFVDLRDRLASD